MLTSADTASSTGILGRPLFLPWRVLLDDAVSGRGEQDFVISDSTAPGTMSLAKMNSSET
ncbi:hypothetical protein DPV78_005549 [Talaromyces pinophilus]|nr:hypothetical protein DPV78_005549 [Talaromyces pinophilus]